MNLTQYLSEFSTTFVNIIGPMPHLNTLAEGPSIYVDGGSKFKTSENGFSVGDNDSYVGHLDQVISKEKDFSDLAFALSHCNKFKEIYLHGFLGERKDHEIMNFGEVFHFLKNKKQVKALFENKIIFFSQGLWSLSHQGIFSVMGFEDSLITLRGDIKYKLEQHKLKAFSSHGLSNESKGHIYLENQNPIMLFLEP